MNLGAQFLLLLSEQKHEVGAHPMTRCFLMIMAMVLDMSPERASNTRGWKNVSMEVSYP
jgi:hypothetical protein